jgi:hypothetical protein
LKEIGYEEFSQRKSQFVKFKRLIVKEKTRLTSQNLRKNFSLEEPGSEEEEEKCEN